MRTSATHFIDSLTCPARGSATKIVFGDGGPFFESAASHLKTSFDIKQVRSTKRFNGRIFYFFLINRGIRQFTSCSKTSPRGGRSNFTFIERRFCGICLCLFAQQVSGLVSGKQKPTENFFFFSSPILSVKSFSSLSSTVSGRREGTQRKNRGAFSSRKESSNTVNQIARSALAGVSFGPRARSRRPRGRRRRLPGGSGAAQPRALPRRRGRPVPGRGRCLETGFLFPGSPTGSFADLICDF